MNRKVRTSILLVSMVPILCISQTTTTLDYLNTNLGSACNVFNPSVTINSVAHHSYAGGATWSSTFGLQLPTIPSGANPAGTAIYLNYSFRTGYSYVIAVTAEAATNAMLLKTAVVPDMSQFHTNSQTACTPDPNVMSYNIVGTGNLNTNVTTTFTRYATTSFTVSSLNTYLVVWSSGLSGLSLDALNISKIEITETAQAPSFTLPATTPVPCGSTSQQNFTVTTASNPNNLTITDYTWHLGATPNGWLYNGSAAQQTFSTGTTSSISLTPICGLSLSNVSATVTAGGTGYNTNTSTINMTTPSLSINGEDALCSTPKSYSVSNLPCDASVTWSFTPSGIVSPNCTSCNSTTLTQTGDGYVTATATVTSSTCTNLTSPTKTISVGSAVSGYYNVISDYVVSYLNPLDYGGGSVLQPKNKSVLFSIQLTSTNLSNVSWGVSGTYNSYTSGSNFLNLYMTTPSISWTSNSATVTLNATGPCGPFTKSYTFQAIANGSFAIVQTSPNPATNNLNVVISTREDTSARVVLKPNIAPTNSTLSGTRLSLYSVNTGALIKQWTFAEDKLTTYNLNISGVPSGVYVLKFERKDQTATTKVVVQ
jgi:hypothetical protein